MIHNTNTVPFVDLNLQNMEIKKEVLHELGEMIDKSQFILGEQVEIFEKEFADYCESGHSVGVASGTDALTLAVRSLALNPGDEVILPVNTFVATAEAVVHGGGTPVLVDIQSNSYNIDTDLIENSITPKTKAIIPVHLYGKPADMDPIMSLSKKYGITVIEDAAQAHGALYKGKKVGSIGHIGCFSFYPSKNLGAWGDGGAIVTSDNAKARKFRELRDHGSSQKNIHTSIGYTSRLDAIQALVLNKKLSLLDEWNNLRKSASEIYNHEFDLRNTNIIPPKYEQNEDHVYHIYAIQLPSGKRDTVQEQLNNSGIMTGIHYPNPIHKTEAFSYIKGSYPVAEAISTKILSLPMYPGLKEEEIKEIVKLIDNTIK